MATTFLSPASWSTQETSGASQAYIFEQARVQMTMMDMLDPINSGMVALQTDFAGKGSDTLRVVSVDGIGWDQRMTALGSETDAITPSTYTNDYTSVTVAEYGLGYTRTNRSTILAEAGVALSLEQLMAMLPMNFLSTLRYLACVQGATIGTIIGSATDALDADDAFNLAAAMISTPGASQLGAPRAFLHREQVNQLRSAFRTEPAYQAQFDQFMAAAQVPNAEQDVLFRNFMGLGFDVSMTNDVQQSGGAYQGFATSAGGIGWAKASASRINLPAAVDPMYMDNFGVYAYKILDQLTNAIQGWEARANIGVALGNSSVYFQRRLRSVV